MGRSLQESATGSAEGRIRRLHAAILGEMLQPPNRCCCKRGDKDPGADGSNEPLTRDTRALVNYIRCAQPVCNARPQPGRNRVDVSRVRWICSPNW